MIKTFVKRYLALLPCAAVIIMLVLFRIWWTGTLRLGFIGWNIFLALLPLLFSHLATNAKHKWQSYSWGAAWLLFFPNSAYLLTDLVHLNMHSGHFFWLDLSILFAAGVYGVLLGLISLRVMEGWYSRFLPGYLTPLLTIALLMLCGYGIYLGRIERWNSWDILTNPFDLVRNVAHEVRHPFQFRQAWGMSVLFGGMLGMFYYLQRHLSFRVER